jgi:hypothetical protein
MLEQVDQYLDALFDGGQGNVAVATKRGESWTEESFEWPRQRGDIYAWARGSRRTADCFINPALRRGAGRVKNDGAHLRWLWADIDWQDVPADKITVVENRIKELATMQVRSGSGNNVHVYVKMDRVQTLDVWRRLNAGLRAYLYADAKHTDNALLRMPGTINHKPEGGPVRIDSLTNRPAWVATASDLLGRRAWQDVVITDDRGGTNDGSYDTVDVSEIVRGRIKAMVTMDVDEARGRYGTRHGAVYQVTTWLSKRGFTADQIHTMMAAFPAGVDKEETERGYSLHVDIARCLSANPTVEAVIKGTIEDGALDDDALEVVDEDEPDTSIEADARKLLRRWDVEAFARRVQGQRAFSPPPEDASYSWGERVDQEPPEVEYAVADMAAVGQNITITGQYKAGKTMFSLNLVHALVDAADFLGQFKVGTLDDGSSVGLWSLEMTDRDLDAYLRPMGMQNPLALEVLAGRGYGVNVLSDVGRTWAVNWLSDRQVTSWVIDSHARLCRMAGVDENDNGAVLSLLHRLDEIKQDAGVGELYYLAHTGRGEQQEGRERARGATVLDDWADARWVLTRDGNTRFLMVEGRGVADMETTSLAFDKKTNGMMLGTRNKAGARVDGLVQIVNAAVNEQPGVLNKRSLLKIVTERAGSGMRGNNDILDAVEEAVECGFIEVRRINGREVRHYPTGYDATVTGGVDGVSHDRSGGATPRVLDMSKAGPDRSRRRGGRERGK